MRIAVPPKLVVGVIVALLVFGALALAWKYTPLSKFADPERIARQLDAVARFEWAPFAFIGAFVLGGLVVFPVTVMSAATAIVFPPVIAVFTSFTGIMLSAALLHWIGARLIAGHAREWFGDLMKRVDAALSDRSIITIAAIRMVPIAPFTLVNVLAGCLNVRFRDYMFGTALGLAPGITMICIFGRQVREFWRSPSVTAVLAVVGICLAWLTLSLVLQRWVSRRRVRLHHAT